MITCVSMNPSVDRTVYLNGFNYGGLNRVDLSRSDPGGKGINAAVAAKSLGLETECVGFMPKDRASFFERKLAHDGINYEFVPIEGSARVNIKIVDQKAGLTTELNELGPHVTEDDLNRLAELIQTHAELSDYLILTGSLPKGCPVDYYFKLCDMVSGLGIRVVLDADGEVLRSGIDAKPFMLKPNINEFERLMNREFKDIKEIKESALTLIDKGIEVVAVSLGSKGAFITNGDESFYAPKISVNVQSTVGAGDAMVAGLISGFMREASLEETFIMGVACATACVMQEGVQIPNKTEVNNIIDLVQVSAV